MKSNFRLKLFLVMVVFAVIISFMIATIDHLRFIRQATENNRDQVKHIEEIVKLSLDTTDKAYFFFDKDTTEKMKENTNYLLNMYEKNPKFDTWNFKELRDVLGMDIYIIDEENVISYSNIQADIGLDFSKCCKKLERTLNEIRATDAFFADGIDMEQASGEIKKYSYMATNDRKYMIELGYALQGGAIFQEFNFLRVNKGLEKKYPAIIEINVLNMGGRPLGESIDRSKLTEERRKAFDQTLRTKQITEIKGNWENESAIYRYIPYDSKFDQGTTKNKVIEIIYNENELQTILDQNKKMFIFRLIIIMIITIIISSIIANWISKPMYYAFHDSLTGLKNKAAFDETLKERLLKKKGITVLLVMDLDNFKLINDNLGHNEGDNFLRLVAKSITSVVRKGDTAFRLGGDEFAMMLPYTSKAEAKDIAITIIKEIEETKNLHEKIKEMKVTASIGISLAPEHGLDPEMLYEKADIALYASKEKGKNQYHFYSQSLAKKRHDNNGSEKMS